MIPNEAVIKQRMTDYIAGFVPAKKPAFFVRLLRKAMRQGHISREQAKEMAAGIFKMIEPQIVGLIQAVETAERQKVNPQEWLWPTIRTKPGDDADPRTGEVDEDNAGMREAHL